jgi:hypothetical protein
MATPEERAVMGDLLDEKRKNYEQLQKDLLLASEAEAKLAREEIIA